MEDKNKLHELEIQITKMQGDISHLVSRIDNGMSDTITKIWNKINEDIMPAVEDSKFWVDALKKFSVAIIGTLLFSVVIFIIKLVFEVSMKGA